MPQKPDCFAVAVRAVFGRWVSARKIEAFRLELIRGVSYRATRARRPMRPRAADSPVAQLIQDRVGPQTATFQNLPIIWPSRGHTIVVTKFSATNLTNGAPFGFGCTSPRNPKAGRTPAFFFFCLPQLAASSFGAGPI
jgi:hypothetical protein